MAFLLLSNRSVSRAGIRPVRLRQVFWLAGVAGVALIIFAFCFGMWIGQRNTPAPQFAQPTTDPLQQRFTLQKLGEISAKVVSLENDANLLLKRMSGLESVQNGLNKLEQKKSDVLPHKPSGAAGGPALPPRCADEQAVSAEAATRSVVCLQGLFEQLEENLRAHSVAGMAVPTQTPVPGVELGSPFGNRIDPITRRVAFHAGLDFAAEMGTPIYAAGGGRVIRAGWMSGLGNSIEIDHGNGLVTHYGHASRLFVKEGEIITPRQKIAAVGNSGRSTGPHLHFEVLDNGRYVDPAAYLAKVLPHEAAVAKN